MESNSAWVDFTLTRGPILGKDRNRIGLIVRVKARHDVEEFMSGLAQGRRMQVEAVGDGWINCNQSVEPLEFYNGPAVAENRKYSLDTVGGPLLINRNEGRRAVPQVLAGNGDEVVNLSFLRLAGISNESGVAVGLTGAYSGDYVGRVKTMLPTAVKQFLQDYLVPITISLQIISKSE